MSSPHAPDPAVLRHILTGRYADDGRGQLCPVHRVPLYNCWGLVMALTAAMGVPVPEYAIPRTASGIHRQYMATGTLPGWRRLAAPRAGCVAGMRTHPRRTQFINHFGVMLDAVRMAHIQRGTAVHVVRLDELPYCGMIGGFHAWAG